MFIRFDRIDKRDRVTDTQSDRRTYGQTLHDDIGAHRATKKNDKIVYILNNV